MHRVIMLLAGLSLLLVVLPAAPPATAGVVEHTLTVTMPGAGSGSVKSTPAGINCPPICSANFEDFSAVELSATPDPGSGFDQWGGYCADLYCGIEHMNDDYSVSAMFELARPGYTRNLSVTLAGTGIGTVTSTPPGISCPPTCSADFPEGSSVVLNAAPGTEVVFGDWSYWSTSCDGIGACDLKMFFDRQVGGSFYLTSGTTTKIKFLKYYDKAGKYFKYHGAPQHLKLSVITDKPLADLDFTLAGDLIDVITYKLVSGEWKQLDYSPLNLSPTGSWKGTSNFVKKGKYRLLVVYPDRHMPDGAWVAFRSEATAYFWITG